MFYIFICFFLSSLHYRKKIFQVFIVNKLCMLFYSTLTMDIDYRNDAPGQGHLMNQVSRKGNLIVSVNIIKR